MSSEHGVVFFLS